MNGGTSIDRALAARRRRSQALGSVMAMPIVAGQRIMRANDAADAVLERRHDPAAVGVILRICAKTRQRSSSSRTGIAANLDVAFLEHVEQADLDLGRQVGQLVHAEDAAIAARDQAEVHGQLAGQIASLGVLDHVDLADQIRDGDVRRGQLFVIALVAARSSRSASRRRAGRSGPGHNGSSGAKRIVVDFAAGDDRNRVVEQMDELPEHARLGLAAQAEEEHVVLGQDGVLHLRQDGFLVAEDAVEDRLARLELADEVAAHLVLDAGALIAGGFEFAEGAWQSHAVGS